MYGVDDTIDAISKVGNAASAVLSFAKNMWAPKAKEDSVGYTKANSLITMNDPNRKVVITYN